MAMTSMLMAGVVAGIAANLTGWLITGRLFHSFQASTPATWRAKEGTGHYTAAALLRIFACIQIAFAFAALNGAALLVGHGWAASGVLFGLLAWLALVLPVLLEIYVFVNWHRGMVTGLLLDWLVLCGLAGLSASWFLYRTAV